MRNTIKGFNQNKIIKYDLDIKDVMILRYFVDFMNTDKMTSVVIDNKVYYWVNYKKIKEDLPILKINNNDAFRKRFKKLEDAGILIHHHSKEGGSYSYYNLGEKYYDLTTSDEEEVICEEAPSDLKLVPSELKSAPVSIKISTPTDKKHEQNNLSTKYNYIYI